MDNLAKLYSVFTRFHKVSIDTRTNIKNAIFFGIKGENFDGNDYISDALKKGAVYAVTDRREFIDNKKCLVVDDPLEILQQLAKNYRKKYEIPVIGLTGSNGKTTTKELIAAVLKKKYKILATKGNLNNHIGVPLTILELQSHTQIAIIEMGANHKGEIADLCEIAQPNFGLITNIGRAHLEGFGSPEGVIQAKNELYQYLRKTSGSVFVKYEDSLLRELSSGISCSYYGFDEKANCNGRIISRSPYLKIELNTEKGLKILNTQFINSFQFDNIMAASCIGQYFCIPAKDIVTAIEDYSPQNNRAQIIKKKENLIILDAYNANPSSMEIALKEFAEMDYQKKAVIIGDMLELGNTCIKEHQLIIDLLQELDFDQVFLIGTIFSSETIKTSYNRFATAYEMIAWIKKNPFKNYSIFLKASRKIELEKLVDFL